MHIRNKYLIEAIVFFSYVLFAMAWVGGTASMSELMAQLQLNSWASASFISGAVTLAKIAGTFVAAWVAFRLGLKAAFLLSCLLVGCGAFTPFAANFDSLLVSRFLLGLGGALMIVYFNPIVLQLFSAQQRPTINGLNAVAFNVGTAIIMWAMVDINYLSGGWRNSLWLFAAGTLFLAVLWWRVQLPRAAGVPAHPQANEQPANYGYRQALAERFNWVYALSYSGLLAFYICLFTFYPKAGISASKWVIGFGIIGTVAGILYSKRQNLRLPVIRYSGLVQALMVAGVSFSPWPWCQTLCAMVLGFVVFFPITALVTLPYELPGMSSQRITVVFSLFWSISYLLATLLLWVFGLLVDINGDFTLAFALIFICSWSLFVGSFWLPEPSQLSSLAQHDGV